MLLQTHLRFHRVEQRLFCMWPFVAYIRKSKVLREPGSVCEQCQCIGGVLVEQVVWVETLIVEDILSAMSTSWCLSHYQADHTSSTYGRVWKGWPGYTERCVFGRAISLCSYLSNAHHDPYLSSGACDLLSECCSKQTLLSELLRSA